jgi:hypothetical protein
MSCSAGCMDVSGRFSRRCAGAKYVFAVHSRQCPGVHVRCRRGPAAVQDVIVGIKTQHARLWIAACAKTGVANVSDRMAAALRTLILVIACLLRDFIGGEIFGILALP